jgi:hypothetical protein
MLAQPNEKQMCAGAFLRLLRSVSRSVCAGMELGTGQTETVSSPPQTRGGTVVLLETLQITREQRCGSHPDGAVGFGYA